MLRRVFDGRNIAWLFLSVWMFAPPAPAMAEGGWTGEAVNAADFADPVPETRQRAPDGLPDGLVAKRSNGDIRAAWYGAPTTRYGHAVLGDGVEAGSLVVTTAGGRTLELVLPDSEVFEDRYPRLADLDMDGSTEIVTIRSSLAQGASVTVYGLQDGDLVERATTGFIGRANRWLNIAGIADFDGNPGLEIAFVRTPHIGGTLFFYTFEAGSLSNVGAIDGFSNHFIGSRELRLSAVSDVNGDGRADIALPSDNRRVLRIVGFAGNGPAELAHIPLSARVDKAIGVEGNGKDVAFIVGLDDRSTVRISR